MNLPQTAGCNFWETTNIMYCQMLFSLYDSLISLILKQLSGLGEQRERWRRLKDKIMGIQL